MPDKGRVIRGLECCKAFPDCENCPYEPENASDAAMIGRALYKAAGRSTELFDTYCTLCLNNDALALLKGTPRVLTFDEMLDSLQDGQYVWVELKDDEGQLYYSQIGWITPEEHGECKYSFHMPGSVVFEVTTGFYNKEWRVWACQPSLGDMYTTEWEEVEDGSEG